MYPPLTDEDRLAAYYAVDPKTSLAPVPTPLDRATAVRFISEKFPSAEKAWQRRRLAAVAIFYDLRETAPVFGSALTRAEKDAGEAGKTAESLLALAWIGDSAQWEYARRYFHDLVDRMTPDEFRDTAASVAFAFGPREGTAYVRQWAAGRLARVDEEKASDPDLAARSVKLRHFVNMELARTDRALTMRGRVEEMAPQARVAPLIALYVRDPKYPGISPELANWAGLAILRLVIQVGGAREAFASEFLRTAMQFSRTDAGPRRPEFDQIRARCLRAAGFLRQPLDPVSSAWLAQQKDLGTDLLALRPDWEYPARPSPAGEPPAGS